MKTKHILYILPIFALFACEPEFDDVNFNGGTADFTRTVAVGNSLTAGYQSNALSLEGQENSIPNIIAQQMQQVAGGAFKQPLLSGEAASKGAGIEPSLLVNNLILPELFLAPSMDCLGAASLAPKLGVPYSSASFFNPVGANGPYNNVGVPGAKVLHLNFSGYGNPANLLAGTANPYFVRFANPANLDETMVQAALRVNPTFFELWIGNNDVLGYATTGGDEGTDAITAQGTFAALYKMTLDSLTKNGAKGVLANIPDITAIPYFTTVKWNALVLSSAQAASLSALATQYNTLVQLNLAGGAITQADADKRMISYNAGANGLLTYDASLMQLRDTAGNAIPGYNFRQLREGELLILRTPGDSIKCAGFGSVDQRVSPPRINPITENFVLDADEVNAIRTAIAGYNRIIKEEADNRVLAHVDVNSFLNRLSTTGISVSGINFTSALVTGGAFSLDGVHPTTQGYAVLANEFIKAINGKYSANIPQVEVTSYPAVEVGP